MNLIPFSDILKEDLPDEDVFIYHMPKELQRGILIMTGVGGAQLSPSLPDYKKARIQLVIRETEFKRGFELANLAKDSLNKSRLTSESIYILTVRPLHDPIAFPKSEGGFIEFSINFETVYVEH